MIASGMIILVWIDAAKEKPLEYAGHILLLCHFDAPLPALAFYRAQQSSLYDIAALFTVVHAQSQNVPMPETPLTLIRRQAQR